MISNRISWVLAKEIGQLLASYRQTSHLNQTNIADRLGLSPKSGKITISRLETGNFRNLSLDLVLGYLDICEMPWSSFFEKLSAIYFNKQHDKIITQVPTTKFQNKVDRDVAKYTHSIQTKFSQKQNIKPLTQQEKEKMSVGLGKYRAIIEPIEKEITLLLGDSGELPLLNQFYKAFARECYSALRKNTAKTRNGENTKEILTNAVLNIKLNQIIEKWVEKGLKREILEQVKEIPIKYFQNTFTDETNYKTNR
jgi:transcriptional regulator with XRE-family HTH domain